VPVCEAQAGPQQPTELASSRLFSSPLDAVQKERSYGEAFLMSEQLLLFPVSFCMMEIRAEQ